jgi:hypothetical protein
MLAHCVPSAGLKDNSACLASRPGQQQIGPLNFGKLNRILGAGPAKCQLQQRSHCYSTTKGMAGVVGLMRRLGGKSSYNFGGSLLAGSSTPTCNQLLSLTGNVLLNRSLANGGWRVITRQILLRRSLCMMVTLLPCLVKGVMQNWACYHLQSSLEVALLLAEDGRRSLL